MSAVAMFFDSQAARDAAYKALLPLFVGDDHGVSGGGTDLDGKTVAWQLWGWSDADESDLRAKAVTATIAMDGEVLK